MDAIAFLAAFVSAIAYAGWNAAARARKDPGQGFAVVVVAAGVIAAPAMLFTGPPAPAALPWMAGSITLNLVAMRALMATYRRTPFSVGFPIARGLTPPLVAITAALIDREALTPLAVLGMAAVSGALLVLALKALHEQQAPLSGLLLAVTSSLFTAGYTYMDALGARHSGDVLAYGITLAVVNALLLGGLGAIEGRSPLRFTRSDWAFGLTAAVGSMFSYLLLLFAFTRGPIGPLSAIRETSVLFATGLAAWLLKERVGRIEWGAAVVAVVGIALIRLS